MVRPVGTLTATILSLTLPFVPVNVGAQTSPDPCYAASATADQKIAACSALLGSGTLSATNTATAYRMRASAYYSKEQYDLAIADYTVALKTYLEPGPLPSVNSGYYVMPWSAIMYNARGDAYRAKGQGELAIADYTAALRIEPRFVPPSFGRGMALFALGRFGESASDFKRRVDLHPPDAYAILWFHIARLRSGDNDNGFPARSTTVNATKWPAPVFGLYLGRLTPEQALSAASNADERCEASFYIAEWQLWHHETALAQSGFARALETCPHSFSEYEGARAELVRLPK